MTDDEEKADAARRLIELARKMTEHAQQQGLTSEVVEEVLLEKT